MVLIEVSLLPGFDPEGLLLILQARGAPSRFADGIGSRLRWLSWLIALMIALKPGDGEPRLVDMRTRLAPRG